MEKKINSFKRLYLLGFIVVLIFGSLIFLIGNQIYIKIRPKNNVPQIENNAVDTIVKEKIVEKIKVDTVYFERKPKVIEKPKIIDTTVSNPSLSVNQSQN